MDIAGLFGRCMRSRGGGIALIAAMLTPVLVGATGLATDTMTWTLYRRAMQREADSGAIAGAFALAQGKSVSATVAADLVRNANFTLTVPAVVENAPTTGSYAGNAKAVRVALATDLSLPFSAMITRAPQRISVEAVAALVADGDFCVLALESTNRIGITMSGNATVDLACGLMTNATAVSSVSATGSSTIKASPVSSVGGLVASSNYIAPTVLIPYAVAQLDPYAALPDPSFGSSSKNGDVKSNQTKTLSPGAYQGMSIQGNATLQPGTYYVDGSSFSVGAQAVLSGTGVTIVLTSATAASNPSSIATLDINGGAKITLSASSSGTYAGVLIYQDRRATDGNQTNKMNGNAASTISGSLYFPRQELQYNGTAGAVTDCLQIVSRRITFIGNSTVRNLCPAAGASRAFRGARVKLVA